MREELPEKGLVNPGSFKAPSLAWSGEGGRVFSAALSQSRWPSEGWSPAPQL